ncbi:MAG: hypothetical protein EBZ59_02430, partial [Planctomycetia bacterium]|nr:hypothetical protein [Planctomycetia bacterium]
MHSRAALFRFTTWLSLAGYVLVASGLPLPVDPVPMAAAAGAKRLAVKDRTQPFPCMDKPCGCATADQCFTRCCCNTPSQTLAWAKAHRVDSAVIAALQRRVAAEPADASADATCCSTSDHLGSDHLGSKQASCCSATAAVAVEPTGGSEEVVSTATPPVVGSSPGGASRGGAFQIGGAEVC